MLNLSYLVPVKFTVEISQNFAAFSEYMNFKGVSLESFDKTFIKYCLKKEKKNVKKNFQK